MTFIRPVLTENLKEEPRGHFLKRKRKCSGPGEPTLRPRFQNNFFN
jgi:hypothetical protein